MQGSRSKIWLFLTIILGLATTLLIASYLKNVTATTVAEPMTTVVAASQRIPEGSKLTKEMLKEVSVPVKYKQAKAVSKLDEAINKVTAVEIVQDQVVLSDQLATSNTNELTFKIPEGYRAVTIAVNPPSEVAGLIKPGNKVDVLLTYQPANDDIQSITLLQEIQVLAVGSDMLKKDGAQAAETATLALKPDDSEKITLAENVGKLKLVLCPAVEEKSNQVKAIDLKQLQTMYP